jgi:hypothetical protein
MTEQKSTPLGPHRHPPGRVTPEWERGRIRGRCGADDRPRRSIKVARPYQVQTWTLLVSRRFKVRGPRPFSPAPGTLAVAARPRSRLGCRQRGGAATAGRRLSNAGCNLGMDSSAWPWRSRRDPDRAPTTTMAAPKRAPTSSPGRKPAEAGARWGREPRGCPRRTRPGQAPMDDPVRAPDPRCRVVDVTRGPRGATFEAAGLLSPRRRAQRCLTLWGARDIGLWPTAATSAMLRPEFPRSTRAAPKGMPWRWPALRADHPASVLSGPIKLSNKIRLTLTSPSGFDGDPGAERPGAAGTPEPAPLGARRPVGRGKMAT